jgi:hypothetical protein
MNLDFTRLRAAYEKYLRPYEVEWPIPAEEPGLWLLHENLHTPVSQEDLVAFYRKQQMEYKRQLRHIAGRGWHVASGNTRATRMPTDTGLKRDELMLISVTAPNPIWLEASRLKRMGRAGITSWNEMLRVYEQHGCAVCGQHFKHFDKGHLNPNLSQDLSNIVPMCVKCNNWAGARNLAFELDGLIARPIIPPRS